MTSTALKKLRSEALSLPQEDRAELAHELLRSLDEPRDVDAAKAWDEELDRRLDAIDAGTAQMIDKDELRRRMKQRIDQG
jgi:putative addiction module component (TIGR02574 family)